MQLRHVYGQDPGLFQEFSGELLSPLLRLIPSAVSPPEAVRLASTALLSLRENCPSCLFRQVCTGHFKILNLVKIFFNLDIGVVLLSWI